MKIAIILAVLLIGSLLSRTLIDVIARLLGDKNRPWWTILKTRYERRRYKADLMKGMGWRQRYQFQNELARQRRQYEEEQH